MGQQRVDESAIGVTCRRMDNNASRLIHHHDVLILKNNIERQTLWLPIDDWLIRHDERHLCTGCRLIPRLYRSTIHRQSTLFNPGRKAISGVIGEQLSCNLVQTHAMALDGDARLQAIFFRCVSGHVENQIE